MPTTSVEARDQDLRFAVRLLVRERWFAAAAVRERGVSYLDFQDWRAASTSFEDIAAYAVTRRTQEIGIRMALGSRAGQAGWMVLRRGLVQLGLGLAIGIWGALTVGRLFESRLVDTPPADPVTQASVAALLGGVAVVACLLPARRAARLDPMVALRHE